MRFIFHKGEAVAEQEENSSVIRLIRGSELIARSSDSESARTYYHYASDEMGSTTHIVNENGNVQNRYAYDAWGRITVREEAVPNRFTYYGQQIDPITQQYYLRARFYNPVLGRFTQEDTYRGDGLNLYAYCANNPVYYVDPSGNTLSNCQKDAYDKLRNEGFTAAEVYQAVTHRIGVKTNAMTDRQLQMAVDYLYMKGNPKGYNYNKVYALTLSDDGRIVFSANRWAPHRRAVAEAQKMFGENLIVARGSNRRPEYLLWDTGWHAEPRGASKLLEGTEVSSPYRVLNGVRQATSAYSCPSCTAFQEIVGIYNVTGFRNNHSRLQRIADDYSNITNIEKNPSIYKYLEDYRNGVRDLYYPDGKT